MDANRMRRAFIDAVIAAPDDDAPRLIFADWLDEQGGEANAARAEHIRMHCRIMSGQADRAEVEAWQRREQEIVKKYRDAWLEADDLLHPALLSKSFLFYKGFLQNVTLPGVVFLTQAEKLFARAPIRHLIIGGLFGPPTAGPILLGNILRRPELSRLHSLTFNVDVLDDETTGLIINCPYLDAVQNLTIRCRRSIRAATRTLRGKFGDRFYRGRI